MAGDVHDYQGPQPGEDERKHGQQCTSGVATQGLFAGRRVDPEGAKSLRIRLEKNEVERRTVVERSWMQGPELADRQAARVDVLRMRRKAASALLTFDAEVVLAEHEEIVRQDVEATPCKGDLRRRVYLPRLFRLVPSQT